MKATTKGMQAMHAARRTCEVNPNPRSFTEVSHPFSDRRFSLPVYNIETNILSIGHAGFSCRILARFEDRQAVSQLLWKKRKAYSLGIPKNNWLME